ncbi:hypothetical protein J3A83DRAFT_4421993 [Scleroderma citrinum]
MKKEYMDCILTWSQSLCPLDIPFKFVGLAMAGLESPLPGETLSNKMRNFKLVKLKHRDVQFDNTAIDGWQRKLEKGVREIDLHSNQYKIYPCPDMGVACDTFRWLLLWVKWVEYIHLGHSMAKGDFLFPAVGTNGILQPGIPLSHDTVQRWIDEAIVQWWGRWADSEQWDTLMRYLLNELYCYENDHSNALGPISQEADHLLAGEGTLIWPASTEALHLAHASLTADVATLHASVNKMSASQAMMSEDVRDLHQKLGNMSNLLEKPLHLPLHMVLAHHNGHWGHLQTLTISTHLTPRTESWKDIICHWTEGEEWLGLTVPLKDWPHSWYNGLHGQKFNSKYYQRKVVATEYLDEFHENEKDFLKAYGSTTHLGHTSLLKAILAACKEYPGNGEHRRHLINETQGDSSPTGSVV